MKLKDIFDIARDNLIILVVIFAILFIAIDFYSALGITFLIFFLLLIGKYINTNLGSEKEDR